MAKRSATSELNHDNWDRKEEKEDPGNFTPLSGDELQNRVIRKAKRSLNKSGSSPLTGSSPFAKFSGFMSTSATSPFVMSQNKTNSTDSSSFFLPVVKKEVESSNGSAEKNVESGIVDSKRSNNSSTAGSSNTTTQEKQARSIEYYRQLQSLNESVFKWMELHLAKNACCDFTPVFNDYKKHMDSLNVTYPIRKKEITALPFDKDADVFKRPSVTKDNDANPKAQSALQKEKQEEETDYGAHFSSNTTNTSSFSFGMKLTPTATSSISPSGPASSSKEEEVNETKNEDNKSTSGFTFGFFSKAYQPSTDKPFSFASAPIGNSTESEVKEGEEYVPPKNDFVAVSEEDALYSKRCKLFFKKDGNYAERGVGTLYLKSLEGKTQLLIRADTNLGNILLNIMLSASLPMTRNGKNNVMLMCIPNPPLDAKNPDSKEAIPTLIRVKTSEDADELLETLNKHKS